MLVGGEGVAPKMEAEKIELSSKAVISFNYFESCFSMDGGPQYDVEMRVNEGLTVFGAMKMVFKVMSLSLSVKRVV